MDSLRGKFLLAGLVILVFLLPCSANFEHVAAPMDEGSLLLYPELFLKGKLPYRDFETFYGPANIFFLSGVYAGFGGPDILIERGVGLLYQILAITGIFLVVQRWNAVLAAGCMGVAAFLLLPLGLPAFAWMGGVACAIWSIFLSANPESSKRCLSAGFLAGGAVLFRADLGPAVIASGLPLFLLMSSRRRWGYLAGASVAMLPLGWLVAAGDVNEILNNLFLFPVLYSGPYRRLPIFSGNVYLIGLFFAHLLAVFVNIAAGITAVRADRRDQAGRLILALGLLGLGLTHQAAQRFDVWHVLFAAFLSLSALPLSIFVIRSQFEATESETVRALLATAVALLMIESITPELTGLARKQLLSSVSREGREAVFFEQEGRSFPFASVEEARLVGKMFDRLNSLASPGQKLFVGPADLRRTNYNDTFIYYMLPQFEPASYFLEMNPGSANRPRSRLARDVGSADWLILNHELDQWNEPNGSAEFGSDAPMQVVRAQFELCDRFGNRDLYRRRATAITKL